jgi:hypothetical protein
MLHGLESETAAEFANTISSATTGEKTSIIDKFTSNLKLIGTKLKPITTATQEAVTKFTSIYTNIENNITEVLTEPLLLADQIMRLKEIPASFIGNFSELKNAYTTLFEASLPDLFSGSYFLNNAKKNEVSTQAFFASTAMIGMCQGFINATYTTKSEALLATEILLDSYKELTDYLETMQSTFEGARGTAEQFIIGKDFSLELASAINATIGNLLSLSQNLKREFSFQLTKDSTIINIAKEYYPEEFKQNEKDKNHNILENIIATNDLTNDEILLLPQGKMIKVYI